MRNAGQEEAQAGIKIARRNINNLRDADDTTLMVESRRLLRVLWTARRSNQSILKEMGIPDHLICLLRNLYAVRKQQLELDMEQQNGSK